MKALSRNQARDILENWRAWGKDSPKDSAEIYYYTVSPDFSQYVKRESLGYVYNPDSAMLVEDALREMFVPYGRERELIIKYYQREGSVRELADELGLPKSTMYQRLDFAIDVFSEIFLDIAKGAGGVCTW